MNDRRRTRADYERGLPGYHDPTARVAGSTPGRSALTLRAVLATFGLVFCVVGAVVALRAELPWFAVALGVTGLVALIDLAWIGWRKYRGEPG